jgi:hypothetical protein
MPANVRCSPIPNLPALSLDALLFYHVERLAQSFPSARRRLADASGANLRGRIVGRVRLPSCQHECAVEAARTRFLLIVVGLFPLSPFDSNAIGSYYTSFSSLRQLKAFAWALAFLPLLNHFCGCHAERKTNRSALLSEAHSKRSVQFSLNKIFANVTVEIN